MRWRLPVLVFWVVVGLPALLILATSNGGFDPLPAAPPLFRAADPDTSFLANAAWLVAAVVVYLPMLLLAAAALARWIGDFVREDRHGP
jgi:hypothetical protein